MNVDSILEYTTSRTTHTGDYAGYYDFDQRFEHPGRTWASATHRVFEPLVELVEPHLVAGVCGPASPGLLRRVLAFLVPSAVYGGQDAMRRTITENEQKHMKRWKQ